MSAAIVYIYTAFFVSSCYSTETLNALYTSNTTLTSSTEYIINRDVIIDENVIFYIPNNTNISFTGDHTLTVRGSLIIACEDIDTASDHQIGIIDPDSSVLVYGNDTNKKQGGILIDSTAIASFCNTKFENLHTAIALNSPYKFILDNCEFENNFYCLKVYHNTAYEQRQITDSIFSYSLYGISQIQKNALIENNIFFNMYRGIYIDYTNNDNIYVINNTFINDISDYNDDCAIENLAYANITFNTFMNFTNALKLIYHSASVKYNEFIDNHIAVTIETSYPQYIKYNNFISNDYSFKLEDSQDNTQPNCNYNYYGINSDQQSVVATQILDICAGQSNGLITWWPWFTHSIDLSTLPSLPTAEATFSTLECSGPNNHPDIVGSKLDVLYSTNVTLGKANSPYYITNDVVINDEVTIIVENSVEIIFVGDYSINVRGVINMCTVDTNNNHQIGLSNASNLIHIHANSSLLRMGTISIESSGNASFCNTKFENLHTAISLLQIFFSLSRKLV